MDAEMNCVVEYHRRKVNRLIDEKVRWQYSDHKGITAREVQDKLDEYDRRIRREQRLVKVFFAEYLEVLRLIYEKDHPDEVL